MGRRWMRMIQACVQAWVNRCVAAENMDEKHATGLSWMQGEIEWMNSPLVVVGCEKYENGVNFLSFVVRKHELFWHEWHVLWRFYCLLIISDIFYVLSSSLWSAPSSYCIFPLFPWIVDRQGVFGCFLLRFSWSKFGQRLYNKSERKRERK